MSSSQYCQTCKKDLIVRGSHVTGCALVSVDVPRDQLPDKLKMPGIVGIREWVAYCSPVCWAEDLTKRMGKQS